MAFWKGIKMIISGLDEVMSTPDELLAKRKVARRNALSGKYTISIPSEDDHPSLVAQITFKADINSHDIDLITYEHGTVDVWDDLPDYRKIHVNREINSFLNKLMDRNNASPYT